MASGMRLWTLGTLVLITAAQLAWADCVGVYRDKMEEACLERFQMDLDGLDRALWCSWTHTLPYYESLTNCTYQVAVRMDCYWPNQVVDGFFTHIHRLYFHDCALTGRLLREPPISILGPFLAAPLLVTLMVTALVVWRSKRSEGIL